MEVKAEEEEEVAAAEPSPLQAIFFRRASQLFVHGAAAAPAADLLPFPKAALPPPPLHTDAFNFGSHRLSFTGHGRLEEEEEKSAEAAWEVNEKSSSSPSRSLPTAADAAVLLLRGVAAPLPLSPDKMAERSPPNSVSDATLFSLLVGSFPPSPTSPSLLLR